MNSADYSQVVIFACGIATGVVTVFASIFISKYARSNKPLLRLPSFLRRRPNDNADELLKAKKARRRAGKVIP